MLVSRLKALPIVNERMHHNIAAYHIVVGLNVLVLCGYSVRAVYCLQVYIIPFLEPNHIHDYPEHLASAYHVNQLKRNGE